MGAIAKKIGMVNIYDWWGTFVPLTVLHLDRNQIISQKDKNTHGYDALVVGAC